MTYLPPEAVALVIYIQANDRIAALTAERDALAEENEWLRKRIIAADELAKRFQIALDELEEYNVEASGESYNSPAHNSAIAAYRATEERG